MIPVSLTGRKVFIFKLSIGDSGFLCFVSHVVNGTSNNPWIQAVLRDCFIDLIQHHEGLINQIYFILTILNSTYLIGSEYSELKLRLQGFKTNFFLLSLSSTL
jgi:hypothetical protein